MHYSHSFKGGQESRGEESKTDLTYKIFIKKKKEKENVEVYSGLISIIIYVGCHVMYLYEINVRCKKTGYWQIQSYDNII